MLPKYIYNSIKYTVFLHIIAKDLNKSEGCKFCAGCLKRNQKFHAHELEKCTNDFEVSLLTIQEVT